VTRIHAAEVTDNPNEFEFRGVPCVWVENIRWKCNGIVIVDSRPNLHVGVVTLLETIEVQHKDVRKTVQKYLSIELCLLLALFTLNSLHLLLFEIVSQEGLQIVLLTVLGKGKSEIHVSLEGKLAVSVCTFELYEGLPTEDVNDVAVIVVSHFLAERHPVFLG